MYFNQLVKMSAGQVIRISVLGSNGGFGYSLLAQCSLIPSIHVAIICDKDIQKSREILLELGWKSELIFKCTTTEEITQAISLGGTAVINNYALLPSAKVDMLIESTGVPELSAEITELCLKQKQHVGMVSKETESCVGPYLAKVARDNGVIYTTVDGDQPANLIHLYSWIAMTGLEIIAAGKSSEYDFIWDEDKNTISFLDQTISVPEFGHIWKLGYSTKKTIQERSKMLSSFPQSAVPDYCEMNVVSNSLGLKTDIPELHYPIAKITELAELFIPEKEGGLLKNTGIIDVFNCLRRKDEMSFAGGQFVIVKCHNEVVWQLLKEKGHIVNDSLRYAAIILPYHLMGVESPTSIFTAVLNGTSCGNPAQRIHTVMVGQATTDFEVGKMLSMGGHHHQIEGVKPLLLNQVDIIDANYAHFYIAANKLLRRPVKKGDIITYDDLELSNSTLYRMKKMQ
ncbi:hypothetical protein MCM45_19445 [Providencia rettgeri]|uniref:NAD(P)H-dependent oxidoreductase n=1 Tax=Providencia rettgeri TaxID=587 RepID=UPI001EFE1F59|nr:hypothetical protein [Providencia rettgeri]MCG9528719.1 hypothetical protein [Providencia rettgeri]